jgi:2'-5' RNA ligase
LLKELHLAALQPKSGIRVVPENNLHITLKFLGTVPSSAIAGITAIMDQVAVEAEQFALTLAGAGIFKDAFWLGAQPCEQLTKLASIIEQGLESLGFQPETRPYVPHLTVARLEQKARRNFLSLLHDYDSEVWGNLQVPAIYLFKSASLAGGVQYSVIHTSELKTA